MSLLVKELAAEPDNLHSISGTHRAASRGEVSGHMAHNASQALSQPATGSLSLGGLVVTPRTSLLICMFPFVFLPRKRRAMANCGFPRPRPQPTLPSWEDHFLFFSQY